MTQVDQVVSGLPTDLYTAPRVRAEILPAAFELMTAQREELATLIALENGKAVLDACAEVSYAAEFFLPRRRARRHGVALPGAQLVR
jgi:succinate-semialdehyde dehydrogenase/glutarate-semialdehyde dehydrogenase